MSLIDTHTHLDGFARRGELPAALERARAAGVAAVIATGTEPADWTLYRGLAQAHPGAVHYTAGLHPCSVDAEWEKAVAQLEAFWTGGAAPRPVALGECGLDRFHLPPDAAAAERVFGWQRAAFAAQLGLVKKLGCPLVVHSRGAFAECVAMIDAGGVDWARVVFHCFAEGVAEMAELARRGGRGSFTGILTYKNAGNVRAAAQAQGLARLMLETDAPYLTPAPHRGKPNEPALLRHTADFAAELFGTDRAAMDSATTTNAREFFGLDGTGG
jgi:TatD DNase family protein